MSNATMRTRDMSLCQQNLPFQLDYEVSRFLDSQWRVQDRQCSALGLLLFPEDSRRYRSFYCSYMECVPVYERDWFCRLACSGTVVRREWQLQHVLGCVKLPKLSKLASLGGTEKANTGHRLVAWQQHVKWLLGIDGISALFCSPSEVGRQCHDHGITLTLPWWIGCPAIDHLGHILKPAIALGTVS
jgi:hypothetical protein